jgi:hypothetical protein
LLILWCCLTLDRSIIVLAVTLPDGVVAGQTIHVQAPDGRLNAIVIPPGFGPGSTFTVEFAPDYYAAQAEAAPAPASAPPAPYNPYAPASANVNTAMATATAAPLPPQQQNQPYAPPPNQGRADDGFASGFGSSPVATQVYPTANAYPAPSRY